MNADEIVRHIEIAREIRDEAIATRDRCAKVIELRQAEHEPFELYETARAVSANTADALSSLLAVVEAVKVSAYGWTPNLGQCICPTCKLIRQQLSEVPQ
jgi:hypothetical protein